MNLESFWTPGSAFQFWLAFSRIAAMMLPLGLPSAAGAPAPARLALTAALTLGLWSDWWRPGWTAVGPGWLWSFLTELSIGLMIGLAANAVLEGLFFAMHLAGVQSGYQYASTIDPTSQADSPVLPVIGQLFGLWLFFSLGGDHYFIRALARSFALWPVGSAPAGGFTVSGMAQGGAIILETAVRFALPLIALLVIIDLTLGVFTRAHSQLQLVSVAFPLKMMLALFAMSALLPAWSRLFAERLAGLDAFTRALGAH